MTCIGDLNLKFPLILAISVYISNEQFEFHAHFRIACIMFDELATKISQNNYKESPGSSTIK